MALNLIPISHTRPTVEYFWSHVENRYTPWTISERETIRDRSRRLPTTEQDPIQHPRSQRWVSSGGQKKKKPDGFSQFITAFGPQFQRRSTEQSIFPTCCSSSLVKNTDFPAFSREPDGFFEHPHSQASLNSKLMSSWRPRAYGGLHMPVVPGTPSHATLLHHCLEQVSPWEKVRLSISPALSVRTVFDRSYHNRCERRNRALPLQSSSRLQPWQSGQLSLQQYQFLSVGQSVVRPGQSRE